MSISGAPYLMPWSGRRLDLVHHARGVQQRLGRDAADVQAHAAERGVALDQHRLHAEVGAAERGRIAAGAGAEHQHLALDVGLAGVAAAPGSARGCARRGAAAWQCAAPWPAQRRGRARRLDHQDHRAFADLVVDLDLELLDHAGMRRRDLHRGLVGLDHDQPGVDRDRLAGLDHHLDDRDVLEVADVRDLDFHELAMAAIPSEQHAPQVGEHVGEMHVEARGGGAVDDAVVPRQRQRQRQPPLERLAVARSAASSSSCTRP